MRAPKNANKMSRNILELKSIKIAPEKVRTLAERIPGLSSEVWNAAVEEAKTRFPGEPDYEIDDDWARESYYQTRASNNDAYSEMFTSLL